MSVRPVSIDQLVALSGGDAPPVMLDVRELVESERGRIGAAAVLPRRRVEFRIESLVRDQATPLVTVDGGDDLGDGRTDSRAELAAATLSALGYRDVAALSGGMAAWQRAGLPLVSGAQISSRAFGRRVNDLSRVPVVDVATLRQWQRDGKRVALCDVRSAQEHTDACIPGAVSVPGFEVVSHALDMAAEADAIVLCSSARTRSLLVARTLVDLGLGEVHALDGGTLAWQLAGHPLEAGSRRRRVEPSQAARQFARLGAARLAKHVGVAEVEADELAALLVATSGNFNVYDLRDLGRAAAHVPRSVPVASDTLIVRNEELVAARTAPVVLVDDDDVRALLTGVWLRRLGLPRVARLAGGFAAWTRSGRPAATSAEMPLGWSEASAVTPGLGVDDVGRWLAAYAPARVLHVDTRASYRRGHLPGALWVPRGWLESRIDALVPSLDTPLLVTCADGGQAAYAAAALRRRGHVHVAWLQGGTRLWAAAGAKLEADALPLEEDELLPPARRDAQAMRDYLDRERLVAPRA